MDTAQSLADSLNEDLEAYCATSPALDQSDGRSSLKRLYGFGLLPIVPNIAIPALLNTVTNISKLPHLRGIILGTAGIGGKGYRANLLLAPSSN